MCVWVGGGGGERGGGRCKQITFVDFKEVYSLLTRNYEIYGMPLQIPAFQH